jgi:hypothetical protein
MGARMLCAYCLSELDKPDATKTELGHCHSHCADLIEKALQRYGGVQKCL